MMTSVLDDLIANTTYGGPQIVGEQHDTDQINYGGEDAVRNAGGRRPSGPWDEREYGISLAEAQRRWDEAQTPEAREKVIVELKAWALRRASLDVTNGKVSVMVAGKPPWHGLGVNVAEAVTSADAIRLANLDWEVVKVAMFHEWNGRQMASDDVFATIRQDTGAKLGTVGPIYQPIQNVQCFDFLDSVLTEYGARYESAGAIYGGSKVWMLVKLPEQRFSVQDGDEIEPYAIFTNCHDGTEAAKCFPTTVRVVCANTYRTAGRGKGKGISIRHTGDVKAKVSAARDTLGLAVQSFGDFREAADLMIQTPLDFEPYCNDVLDATLKVTQAQALMGADALAATLMVTEATRELEAKRLQREIEKREHLLNDMIERYESERCQPRGTAWAGFNAVTESADHNGFRRYVGKNKEARRFEAIVSGEVDDLKQVAYAKAMAAVRN